MYKRCTLFALVCVVTYVYAAARIYPYEPKPQKFACKQGCYLESLDLVLPYNEPYYPEGKCEVYTCQTNNQTVWYSCGLVAVQPGCYVTQDLSQHYPDCCSKPVCNATTEAPPTTEASINDNSVVSDMHATNEESTRDDFVTTVTQATTEASSCND